VLGVQRRELGIVLVRHVYVRPSRSTRQREAEERAVNVDFY